MANLLLVVAVAAIVAMALAYVVRPLVVPALARPRLRPEPEPTAGERRRDELFARRDALFVALDELDFDRATGKVEASVYEAMRQRLVDQALVALKEIDDAFASPDVPSGAGESGAEQALPAEVERRIAGVRHGLAVGPGPARVPPRRAVWLAGTALVAFLFAAAVVAVTREVRQAIGQPAAFGAVAPATTGSIAVDPGDARVLYYGYPGGVLISRDGGRAWEPAPTAPTDVSSVRAVGGPRPVVLAAARSGLYASGDRGATWEGLDGASAEPPRVVATSAAQPGLVYLVASDGALLRSDDGGASWATAAAQTPPGISDLAIVDAQRLYAATNGEGVFYSADGGRDWAKANGFVTGLLPTLNVRSIAFNPDSGDSFVLPDGSEFTGALYVATDKGVFRSRDGGVSWELLTFAEPAVAVAVDPQDPRIIYAVDEQGAVFKSADKGMIWRAS